MQINFTETQLNNLLAFLNRVEYKGLQEVQAITEILNALKTIKGGETNGV